MIISYRLFFFKKKYHKKILIFRWNTYTNKKKTPYSGDFGLYIELHLKTIAYIQLFLASCGFIFSNKIGPYTNRNK